MFTALLDACVLYPIGVRDTLLNLAEAGLYELRWSEEVLGETERNILKDRPDLNADDLGRTFAAMRRAFPDAMVSGYHGLVESMTNDPKDRHVLAAAVVGRADVIVTDNIDDFPEDSCAPHDIDVATADDFCTSVFGLAPERVVAVLDAQARKRSKPPTSMKEMLDYLGVRLGGFVTGVEEFLAGTAADEPWLVGLYLSGMQLRHDR